MVMDDANIRGSGERGIWELCLSKKKILFNEIFFKGGKNKNVC